MLRHVDIGFGLGDFASFGKGLTDAFEPLAIGTQIYFVPGNHDDADEIKWICREHENFQYFHGESVTIKGKTFAGLGGGLPGLPSALTEEKAQQILKRFYHLEKLIFILEKTPPLRAEMNRGVKIGVST